MPFKPGRSRQRPHRFLKPLLPLPLPEEKVRRLKRVSPVALAVAVAARESKNAELERENRWRSLLGGIDPHKTPLDHVKLLRERLQLAREMKKNAKSPRIKLADLSQTRGNNSDEGEALIDVMRGDRREKRESFIAGMRGDRGSLAERCGQFSVLPSVTSSVVTKEVGLSWSPERLKQKEVELFELSPQPLGNLIRLRPTRS